MAFPTSAAAFGMKSGVSGQSNAFGNPPSTGGFGSFGSTNNAQPSAFGATNTQSAFGVNTNQAQNQPASGGIFGQSTQNTGFGTTATSQQPSTNTFGSGFGGGQSQLGTSGSGLFGSGAQQQSQQQPTGSVFGASQQPGGSSLFNNTQSNLNTPHTTGGLFGTQQQPQQSTGGLFGNHSQPGGGLFGNSTAQQQQQQQSAPGGLFGVNSFKPATGNIFGNTQPSNNQFKASGFPSAFGHQAPTSTPPTQPLFTKSTKFNDLPEQVQKVLESIESHIQGRLKVCSDLKSRDLQAVPIKSAELIRTLHKDAVNTTGTLESDQAVTEELRVKVDQSAQDLITATAIVDSLRTPQHHGTYSRENTDFPLSFFNRATDQIRAKLQWYKTTIEQLERRLASLQHGAHHTPHSIATTLQAQHATLTALASKTAALDTDLQKIKSAYRDLWRAHTGSARDPFNELDRRPGDGSGLLNDLSSLGI